MTQAMTCKCLEGVCDPHDTGHKANEQMSTDVAQQVPWCYIKGDSQKETLPTRGLVKSFSVIPSHPKIIQYRDHRHYCTLLSKKDAVSRTFQYRTLCSGR